MCMEQKKLLLALDLVKIVPEGVVVEVTENL